MTGNEFIRGIRRLARRRGLKVEFVAERGKGSHGTLYFGDRFWEKEQTKAGVEVFILDEIYANLPTPPFTAEEKKAVADEVYEHVLQQAINGEFARAA